MVCGTSKGQPTVNGCSYLHRHVTALMTQLDNTAIGGIYIQLPRREYAWTFLQVERAIQYPGVEHTTTGGISISVGTRKLHLCYCHPFSHQYRVPS